MSLKLIAMEARKERKKKKKWMRGNGAGGGCSFEGSEEEKIFSN